MLKYVFMCMLVMVGEIMTMRGIEKVSFENRLNNGYTVDQIIELNDFWTFDNFSKTKYFLTFEVYFDIYKPFATDRDKK